MIRRISSGLILVAVLVATTSTEAHHSTAGRYDQRSILEIEGEISRVRWSSPHVVVTINVPGGAGETLQWQIEGAAPLNLARTGITADLFAIGDAIRVAGWPSVRDRPEMFMQNVLLPTGEELLTWVSATPRWSDQQRGDFAHWRHTEGDTSRPELGIFRVWSSTLALPMLFNLGSGNVDAFPLTESGRQAAREYAAANTNLATQGCTPKGMPLIMEQPYPMEFVRDGSDIALRLEEYDVVRAIHMYEAIAPADAEPSPFGYSVGRWDGDTLIVTTTHLDWPWIDQQGLPQSEQSILTERFTPIASGSRLDYELTVTDPATFTRPVTFTKQWLYLPEQRVEAFECDAVDE